jgi:Cu(I)/Ag(I) efflux system membrane fusion protein
MNKRIQLAAGFALAIVIGILVGRAWDPVAGDMAKFAAGSEREVLYWVAPMDPKYRRDEPGKSPMGMDLIPVYADEVDGQPGVVAINPIVVSNLGVRTSLAEYGSLSRRIETVGYVEYDEDTLQHVHTRVEGWIEKLAVTAKGDAVQKGQLLFELYSPTLVNAQQEYLAALRSNNTLLRGASRERLIALGLSESGIKRLDSEKTVHQRVRMYAETEGVVAHLGVREGIYITPATEVMSIAELDRVWVLAEVFERQSAWVKPGQHASVKLDYLPGESWQGTVDYVYPELDPKTRTLKVRLRFDNSAEMLRPNMFARITIDGDAVGNVVHVPREALIRGGTFDRVVVALGGGRFRVQPVELGIESGDRVAILNGVSIGDRIVTSGQFLIDSESNIDAALGRMAEPVDGVPDQAKQEMDADVDDGQQEVDAGMDGSAPQMDTGMDHSQHEMESPQ